MKKKIITPLLVAVLLAAIAYVGFSLVGKTKRTTKINSTKVEIHDKDNNIHLTLPYKEVSSYDSFENIVYMSVADYSQSGMANKVNQYDRKTKKIETLFTTKFKQPSVQGVKTNQNWITWVDSDESGGQIIIYTMNKKTRKIEPVTNEKDDSIDHGFPVLSKDYLAWINYDRKKNKSYVMIRNLLTKKNNEILTLSTDALKNSFLSSKNGNLLLTAKRGENSYCYVYHFSTEKLDEFQVPHKSIGWGELLNDHQLLYLAFFNDEVFTENKLVLFDIQTNTAKEFSSNYMGVNRLVVDENNHVFVGNGDNIYFEKYQIDNSEIKNIGEIKNKHLFSLSYNDGTYLMYCDPSNANKKLIISKELP